LSSRRIVYSSFSPGTATKAAGAAATPGASSLRCRAKDSKTVKKGGLILAERSRMASAMDRSFAEADAYPGRSTRKRCQSGSFESIRTLDEFVRGFVNDYLPNCRAYAAGSWLATYFIIEIFREVTRFKPSIPTFACNNARRATKEEDVWRLNHNNAPQPAQQDKKIRRALVYESLGCRLKLEPCKGEG
jgi:hypothetical protein